MKIAKLAWANIRKSKSATASLLLLIVIASLLLSTGISIFLKMSTFYDDKVEQLHDPHISILMDRAMYDPSFEQLFKANASVKETETNSIVLLGKVNYWFGDSETTDAAAIVNANESRTIAPFKLAEKLEDAQDGDIYVPYSFRGRGGYRLGESLSLTYGEKKLDFRIAGFFETTMLNTSNTGVMKYMLPERGYRKLEAELGDAAKGTMLSVILNDPSQSASLVKDFREFSEQKGIDTNTDRYFVREVEDAKSGNSMTIHFIAMILVVFATLIVGVALIVIKFRVTNMINDGIVNMGVLKALGYTSKQIVGSMTLQLTLIAVAGGIVGAAGSTALNPLFGGMITTFTGLLSSNQANIVACLIGTVVIVALVLMVVLLTAMKIRKLHPVTALRGGLTTHSHKKNRFPLEKTRLGLSLALACKTMFLNLRQNLMIVAIIVGVSFASVFSIVLYYNIAMEKTAFFHLVGAESTNIFLEAKPEADGAKLMAEVSRMDGVAKTAVYDVISTSAEGSKIETYVVDDFAKLENQMVYKGRNPQYDNEIVISYALSRMLGKTIGDTATIDMNGVSKPMLVTGLSQLISNDGKAISMTLEAIRTFDPDYRIRNISVYLNGVDNDAFIQDAKAKYGAQIGTVTDIDKLLESQASVFSGAMFAVMAIILAITVVVVSLILYLVISTMILKRKKEFGIMKATGYTTSQIIGQITLSFVPVVLVGVLLGSTLGGLYSNAMLTMLLSGAGIHNVDFVVKVPAIVLLSAGLILLAYGVSMLVARRIKRISAYGLITE